jgi:hypothetical protein
MLLVAANLANQKTGIKNEAGGDGTEKDDAEKDLNVVLPIEDDPAETNSHGDRGEHQAEREKENDFAAPAYAHETILAKSLDWPRDKCLPEAHLPKAREGPRYRVILVF